MKCHVICTGCSRCCGHKHDSLASARSCPAARDAPCPGHSTAVSDIETGEELETLANPSGDFFLANLESLTKSNDTFRRVVSTGAKSQLVLMSLDQGVEIGEESHGSVEQMFVVVSGRGEATLRGRSVALNPGTVLVVPPGTTHNVRNLGRAPLKLWTLYTPPNHIPGTIHETKQDAVSDAADERYGSCVEKGGDQQACYAAVQSLD